MYQNIFKTETICAISTPHGHGGVSVLRISGPKSLDITRAICSFLPAKVSSHRAYHGFLKTPDQLRVIDEVIVTFFEEGRSYTGEETVEISCHGSPIICEKILEQILLLGARLSNRGEFTYRAFMNGKIDLVQAESVLSVIESKNKKSAEMALRQLDGSLSDIITAIEIDIIGLLANLEASIDFSTEDIEIISHDNLLARFDSLKFRLEKLVSSFSQGRILKDGVRVLLLGRPNVGKSSLLNNFLQSQRAIVTDIPGTTRDLIDGSINFEGVNFTFVDTAGIRDSESDLVEKIGIERSRDAILNSDIILFVVDSSVGVIDEDLHVFQMIQHLNPLVLCNKIDLLCKDGVEDFDIQSCSQKLGLGNNSKNVMTISSLSDDSRFLVFSKLMEILEIEDSREEVLVSSVRQTDLLNDALRLVKKCLDQVKFNLGPEFLVIDLKEALLKVEEVLGKHYDDQILDRIFKEFCIGK